jgi:hypothetical protein
LADAPDDQAGDDSGMISNCPVGTWCREDAPQGTTVLLHSVDAVDANDVFVVGDGGTILRRQNAAWTKMTSGTLENLRAVWALSSTDVWAAGQNGTVLHWNGTAWSPVAGAPNIDYSAAWGSSANDVWFSGTASAVHLTNGSTFTTSAITGTPVGISGSAANDVWIAAESGYLSHYTTSWTLTPPLVNGVSPGTSYFAVGVRASNDVWASTPGTGTIRWNGAVWSSYATGTTLFASIYPPAADNAWGAGGTKVGRWNGTEWTISTPITGLTSSLYGISGTGPHTWAVGNNATILYHHD